MEFLNLRVLELMLLAPRRLLPSLLLDHFILSSIFRILFSVLSSFSAKVSIVAFTFFNSDSRGSLEVGYVFVLTIFLCLNLGWLLGVVMMVWGKHLSGSLSNQVSGSGLSGHGD